jgi:hypothetical protein
VPCSEPPEARMSDVKELFDMVTKQTEPDLDSWKEQEDRQRNFIGKTLILLLRASTTYFLQVEQRLCLRRIISICLLDSISLPIRISVFITKVRMKRT